MPKIHAFLFLLGLAPLLLGPDTPAYAEEPDSTYRLVVNWPTYPEGMQFEMGSGVAVDDEGIIYLFTRDIEHWPDHPLAMSSKMGKSTISMFNRDGDYLGLWGPSDEQGFALGAHTLYIINGDFWVVDRDGHTVKKYAADGTHLLTLGTFAEPGSGPDHLNGPTAVVVQANGNIVVADGYWNSRLVWYTPDGEFIKEVGGWGRGPAEFNTVHALAQTADGRLLAVDLCGGNFHAYMTVPGQITDQRMARDPACTHRIQILDANGDYVGEWTHIVPLSVAVYGDKVYAADDRSHLVILDAGTGEVLDRIENVAIYIHQMAMDAHGDFYFASVYPEHKDQERGPQGPSHRRWTKQAPAGE
ncbi:MAG: hypothetical protein ACE363_14240 [Alphaproteobacteria bacterium]